MPETNYGLLFQKEDTPGSGTYTLVGSVIDCGLPGISTGAIDSTSHSSGGFAQKIPDGLISLSSFKIVLDLAAVALAAIYAEIAAKTIANYRIVFANTLLKMWSFDGFPLVIEAPSADAKKPGELQISVTYQPTGEISFDVSEATGDWYDNVTALFLDTGGELAITSSEEHQLTVYAIKSGAVYELSAADLADLDFASSVGADATVTAGGLIEGVSSGETVVTVELTSDPTINTAVVVTLAS
jgi:hypothetical protein